jgi:hypothetical protein
MDGTVFIAFGDLIMARRTLEFHTFEDAAAEVRQLRERGCTPQGNWTLAQVCQHLAQVLEWTMHGFPEMPGWEAYREIGPRSLARVIERKRMKEGFPLPEIRVPPHDASEAEWAERLDQVLAAAATFPGTPAVHPVFGPTTLEQWRAVQLIHLAHHLSFLACKE